MQPAAGVDTGAKCFGFSDDLLECALGGATNQRRAGEHRQAAFDGWLMDRANTDFAAHRDGWSVLVALNQRDHAIRQYVPRGGLNCRCMAILRSHTPSLIRTKNKEQGTKLALVFFVFCSLLLD